MFQRKFFGHEIDKMADDLDEVWDSVFDDENKGAGSTTPGGGIGIPTVAPIDVSRPPQNFPPGQSGGAAVPTPAFYDPNILVAGLICLVFVLSQLMVLWLCVRFLKKCRECLSPCCDTLRLLCCLPCSKLGSLFGCCRRACSCFGQIKKCFLCLTTPLMLVLRACWWLLKSVGGLFSLCFTNASRRTKLRETVSANFPSSTDAAPASAASGSASTASKRPNVSFAPLPDPLASCVWEDERAPRRTSAVLPVVPQPAGQNPELGVSPVYDNIDPLATRRAEVRHSKPLPQPFAVSGRLRMSEPGGVSEPIYLNIHVAASEDCSRPADDSKFRNKESMVNLHTVMTGNLGIQEDNPAGSTVQEKEKYIFF